MIQASRLSVPLSVLLLAAASTAVAGGSTASAAGSPRVASCTIAPQTPVDVLTPNTSLGWSWAPLGSPWTPLPNRFEDWSWSAVRVEWDTEAGAWGVASAPDPAGAGVFGARLPSDRPIQITRADGTVMLMIGPEGMEYLTVQRGPDGRFRRSCTNDPTPDAAPAASWPEK